MEIADALDVLINTKTLKPGEKFYLFLDKDGTFLGLSMNLRNTDTVGVLKEKDGSLTPFSAEGRVETITERIAGTIERTFAGRRKSRCAGCVGRPNYRRFGRRN